MEIEPSIYAGDFSRLGQQLHALLDAGARIFHVDVGDGHFIDEITIGPIVLQSIAGLVHQREGMLECHMMVSQPARHFEQIKAAGGDSVTFHVEAEGEPAPTIACARGMGLGVGVAFNPDTSVEQAVAAAEGADFIVCMSIHPGLSGQALMPGEPAVSLDDLKHFRQLDSRAPGHPEYRWTSGVEATTGPLGTGAATSVGMAVASQWLAARYNRDGFAMFDFDVYVHVGDGDMMEGVASEAASFAAHQRLANLCWIYDSGFTPDAVSTIARDRVAATRRKESEETR